MTRSGATKAKTKAATPSQPSESSRGFLFLVLGIVIVGLLVVAVFATSRGGDDATAPTDGGSTDGAATPAFDEDAPATSSVTLTGDLLAPMADGVGQIGTVDNDAVVGSVAPTLAATDFNGDDVLIEADGRPKVIYFLAHWCPHCQEEVPLIQGLIDEGLQPDGLDVYAVSTAVDEGRGNFPPQAWLADEGFVPVTVRDDAQASAFVAFGGSGFPYAVYLDGDNQLVARTSGSLDRAAILELWEVTAAS